jgi:hypothetical protein
MVFFFPSMVKSWVGCSRFEAPTGKLGTCAFELQAGYLCLVPTEGMIQWRSTSWCVALRHGRMHDCNDNLLPCVFSSCEDAPASLS